MDDDFQPALPSPEQVKAELEASESEARAGLTTPLDEVLGRIRASVARMRFKQNHRAAAKA